MSKVDVDILPGDSPLEGEAIGRPFSVAGSKRERRWRGAVTPNAGKTLVWSCRHGHVTKKAAIGCAEKELRRRGAS